MGLDHSRETVEQFRRVTAKSRTAAAAAARPDPPNHKIRAAPAADMKSVPVTPDFLGRWFEISSIPSWSARAGMTDPEVVYSAEGKNLLVEERIRAPSGTIESKKGFGSYVAPGQYHVRFDNTAASVQGARANLILLEWGKLYAILGSADRTELRMLARRYPENSDEAKEWLGCLRVVASTHGYVEKTLSRVVESTRRDDVMRVAPF